MIWARMLAYISGTVDQELLLRNENAAAVQSDAAPDRAATDTDGIGGSWSSRQRNPSIGCWGKERCCKSRPQMGQFWAVLVRVADRRERSR